jgi:xanthine dehydrogenase YagT iron-sulfur-binding subunit
MAYMTFVARGDDSHPADRHVGLRTEVHVDTEMDTDVQKRQTKYGAIKPRVTARGPSSTPVALTVNGATHLVDLEPRVSLLDALRDHMLLSGTKNGCDQGTCGACTVWIDGRRMLACLALAIACEGHQVTTIEGLADHDELHPVQQAFIEHDAFQCGYCTSGQIMSAVALVREGTATTDAEIAELMSGNICRCGAYPNIRAAIRDVINAREGEGRGATA